MTTGAVVMCGVRPGLERVALEADAANSSTGTGEAARSSDGVDMVSTFSYSCNWHMDTGWSLE